MIDGPIRHRPILSVVDQDSGVLLNHIIHIMALEKENRILLLIPTMTVVPKIEPAIRFEVDHQDQPQILLETGRDENPTHLVSDRRPGVQFLHSEEIQNQADQHEGGLLVSVVSIHPHLLLETMMNPDDEL
jgi:hypothetical protein